MSDLESEVKIDSYKELINKFKKLDVITKELTLFDVGTRGHFENPTTELLSFFLDSKKEHGLGHCFLNGLQDVLEEKGILAGLGSLQSVETEVVTAKGNRIDLVLETDQAVIVVECKIYHEQNNPFDDYSSYGEQRIKDRKKDSEQEQKLVKLVLCLNGEISNLLKSNDSEPNGWYGLSYQELAKSIETQLSKALLENPYNKWGLFAREFLLHLKELNKMGSINNSEIDFLTENFKAFTELSAYIYEDLMPKIGEKIETDLNNSGLANFECKQKPGKWRGYEPIRRFSNKRWTTQSDITLRLRTSNTSISSQILIYIDKQTDEIVNEFKSSLSEQYLSTSEKPWFELNNTFWGISWEFNYFNIDEASEKIVELMKCLNDLELNHRQPILV
jgi:hypothetical protein